MTIDDGSSKVAKASDFEASVRAYDDAVLGARAGTRALAALTDGAPVGKRSAEVLFHLTAERFAQEHRTQQAALADFEKMYPKSAASYRKAKGL